MDAVFRNVAGAIGVPDDLLRIAFCIVGSFPLSSLVKRIPLKYTLAKEATITALGIFYLAGVFNLYKGVLLVIALSSLTYLLASLFPNKKWMPWANFMLQMGFMLITHCYEQFGDGDFINEIGISGTQMILLQKWTAYAWDVYDGSLAITELNDHQKAVCIQKRPGFLRYASYIFFFPTILTGPACTFSEYNNWFDLSVFKELRTDPNTLPRSGVVVLGLKLAEGLFWVFLYTQTTAISMDHTFVYDKWYKASPFMMKAIYIYMVGTAFRTKYYAAWTLSEAACIHSGLGYNGVDPQTGKLRWNKMQNVKPMGVELGQNIHGVFANWNIITSKWLRHYVYERVTPKTKKPGVLSTFITFLVSAFWHGTRPGYYITFITSAVYQTFGKVYRRQLRPVFLNTRYKRVYDVLTWAVTQLALSYAAIPFIVLDLKPAYLCYYSVHFYIYIGLFISWLLLLGPGKSFVRPLLRTMHADIKKE